MTFEKKIFLKYTMDFNSFLEQFPYVTVAAICCYWVYKEIKFILAENELKKKCVKL